MSKFTESEEFWQSEEGIKVLYWFDAFYKFRMAKMAIKQSNIWGWEQLHDLFQYRKKFHEDIKKIKSKIQ